MEEDVGEYWIIDTAARVVEQWRKGESRPEVLGDSLTWQPTDSNAVLSIDLPSLFREAHGE